MITIVCPNGNGRQTREPSRKIIPLRIKDVTLIDSRGDKIPFCKEYFLWEFKQRKKEELSRKFDISDQPGGMAN